MCVESSYESLNAVLFKSETKILTGGWLLTSHRLLFSIFIFIFLGSYLSKQIFILRYLGYLARGVSVYNNRFTVSSFVIVSCGFRMLLA